MARHKQPIELAELTGATKKDPQRYRTAIPKSTLALGDPPERMADDPKACWYKIAALTAPGVMTGSDRIILEITANLMAEYRSAPADSKLKR